MRFIINFNEEEDFDYIEYFNQLDKEELKYETKMFLKNYIDEEIERRERRKKQNECEHDYKEIKRSRYDEDGEPYFDDDGYYQRVESVIFQCKKCNHFKEEMDYNEGW